MSFSDPGAAPGLRLQTLVRLRWVAVIGQLGAVLVVRFGLGFDLPLAACLGVIAVSGWLNAYLSLRWRPTHRLADRSAAALLAYDILQLAALLWLTGGLQNPFAFLFLVPVTVSATSLPRTMTVALGVLALGLASLLAVEHQPLPWHGELVLPTLYLAGLWAALISGTIFSALYAGRLALEARQMQEALVATETVLAHAQQLSALDGLAAAAAHELGTPLSTIALVAKELKREFPDAAPRIAEDLDLLNSQALRCREILSRLSNREAQADTMLQRLRLTVMLEEIIEPLRGAGVVIRVETAAGEGPEPVLMRNPAVLYGLTNLLENAVDFARSQVEIEARWSADLVSLTIRDDGPGFSEEIYARLGDPFVTSRKGHETAEPGAGHEGMGLGFFIAKTLLQRSGAVVSLSNRKPPQHGAVVHVAWPPAALAVA